MTTPDIWIQILGGVGYAVLIAATQMRTKSRFLVADFVGLVPVVAHYWFLGAYTGAALSALYMASDAAAAAVDRRRALRAIYFFIYPIAIIITALTYAGPSDLLAACGSTLAIAARQQKRLRPLQALVCASAVGWGFYGVAVGSIGQIVFSTLYAAAAGYSVYRLAREPAPSI